MTASTLKNATSGKGGLAWIMSNSNKFMPQIALEKEDGGGSGDDAAAKLIADALAADDKKKVDEKAEADAAVAKKKIDENVTDREADLLKDVMKKKEAQKKAEDALKVSNDRLKEFEGLDAAEIKKLLKDKLDAEKKSLEAAGDFDRLKAMMKEEHDKSMKKVADEKAVTETALEVAQRQINDLTVGAAFATSGFVGDEMTLTPTKARIVFGGHFELEDGTVVGYDKPKGATSRTKLVDASGEPLKFEAAIKKLVEADADSDSIIRSKLKSGTNSKAITEIKTKVATTATGLSRIEAGLLARKKA